MQQYPQRVILLSDTVKEANLENLWNYHRHFYKQLPQSLKDSFAFEDVAGIYKEKGRSQLFAVCTHYKEIEGLVKLPHGRYLCADCTEDNCEQVVQKLYTIAKNNYKVSPTYSIQLVVLSGILQWNYQLQVYMGYK